MKSALRLLVFTMTLVLFGEGFAQVPPAKPETVAVSPERLSRIRTVLQKEVDADRMPGEWTGAAFPYGHPLHGNT